VIQGQALHFLARLLFMIFVRLDLTFSTSVKLLVQEFNGDMWYQWFPGTR
jgi:hypothetical protein